MNDQRGKPDKELRVYRCIECRENKYIMLPKGARDPLYCDNCLKTTSLNSPKISLRDQVDATLHKLQSK